MPTQPEHDQKDAQAGRTTGSLVPPSPDPSTGAFQARDNHSRNSSSIGSIPSHNSANYVSSYYYGNEEMAELAFNSSSNPPPPTWATSGANSPVPSGSPIMSANEQHLIRRLSWGSREQSLDVQNFPGPSHRHERTISSADAGLIRGPLDDVFQETPGITLSQDFDTLLDHTPDAHARPSQHLAPFQSASNLSLDSVPMRQDGSQYEPFDDDADRVILTSHQSDTGYSTLPPNLDHDADRLESAHPSHKSSADIYATAGFSNGQSLQHARSGLNQLSKSIRRISRRVVNLDDTHQHVRLHTVDDDDSDSSEDPPPVQQQSHTHIRPPPPVSLQTLRGKSLGIWSPDSKFRKLLANLIARWWIEPAILALIVANLVVLIIQSGRSVFTHPRKTGYFDYAEDYILLGIFSIYSLEIFARIVVSGLIINPPPIYVAEEQDTGITSDKADTSMRSEHRRQMSRSNTLDALNDFGGSLKTRAQKAFAGPQPLSSSPSETVAYPPTSPPEEIPSQPNPGAFSQSHGSRPYPPGRKLERSDTADMLSSSHPMLFWQDKKAPFAEAIASQRLQAVHHAYLRHSWNRVDLLAVVCFWIAFALGLAGQESNEQHHIYIFRALSVLRCARLLTVTSGTSTILQSLKTAAPILLNVAFFVLFAMLLFSIIGIQSFKGSYRRSCVWVGDLMGQPGTNYTLDTLCGGYVDQTGKRLGFVLVDGTPSGLSPKGFICPLGQICQEGDENPENGTQSFDTIFHSLLQVIVVISSNNWSETMYSMIDADFFASCLYFIIGLIFMNFWLANLFVAVITNSFAALTAKTHRSAFADQKIELQGTEKSKAAVGQRMRRVASVYKKFWGYTKYLWILAIVADVGLQASRATYMSPRELRARDRGELYFTIAFDFEILMRFLAFVLDGDWRSFVKSKQNRTDLVLAVLTSIIQIPVIKNSSVYPWLTALQLARFYRVIAAVPRMKVLLDRVFGSMVGLLNMVLFLLIMVGLASLIAVQLFRGNIPQEDDGEHVEMNFKHIFNSFLAMYQIFTSEDWTTVLYSVLSNEKQFKQAVIGGILICGWFLFANFIVLQMFIAVINENFGVAEGEKRQQQLEHYLRRNEPPEVSGVAKFLNKFSPYRYLRNRNAAKTGSAHSVTGEANVKQHANAIAGGLPAEEAATHAPGTEKQGTTARQMAASGEGMAAKTFKTVRRMLRLDDPEEAVPLDTLRARQFRQSLSGETMLNPSGRHSSFFDNDANDQAARLFADERKLTRMRSDLGLPVERDPGHFHHGFSQSVNDPKIQQAQFIASHPSYDKSYFLFSNHNRFRRFCQSLVPPAYGERLFGRPVSHVRHRIFQIVIFLGIAGSVVSAAIATPAYRRGYYERFGRIRASWFSVLEISLSTLFLGEFAVKTIADGFIFTPNAYVLSVWNALDLFVLITLLVNVSTELLVIGGVSRFTRSLKAFRALRLINLSSLMRETFHAVMIAGAGRILDASILAILYIIPYAVWGQNLFAGLLYSCNDDGDAISTKFDCVGEYSASPGSWTFLAPRVWANPTDGSDYSFDDFKSSLLILFEIISLEGWIDVMTAAMSVAGKDRQLESDNRQVNALFFLIYNLIGSTTVLTLFVAVIIENFQTFSGAAYQTAEQRQWIDLRKLIMRQRPSKRPKERPAGTIRSWCYERAVQKHGWWSRGMTLLYAANIIVLMTQRYEDPDWVDQLRDVIYLAFTVVYSVDIFVRLYGLGWRSFRENAWNLYDLFVVVGTLATTIPLLSNLAGQQVNVQLQKIFLTCVAFKLVQKSNALNQLFRTAMASLPAILSLFLLWLTMFLVWAIMLIEVFGLTKWGENETYSKNFSTMIGSLVFLSMMSSGEAWNSYMHDYTVSPPQCTPSDNYLMTDCGSKDWAFFLFITWNVISMYIFLNMFTGTVVENFSYIFDMGGKPKLSREEMRVFKEAWAKFDKDRTGYLQQDHFVPFFHSLTGVLEVGIYPRNCSLKALTDALRTDVAPTSPSSPSKASKKAIERILDASPLKSPQPETRPGDKGHFMWPPSPTTQDNRTLSQADRLNQALAKVDVEELRMRKFRFNRLYHEAVLTQKKGKGMSFTKMLTLLAHYKLIDDAKALGVKELIERRELLEKVDNSVNLERLRGVLKMVYTRRRYLAMKEEMDRSVMNDTFTNAPILIHPGGPQGGAKPSTRQRPTVPLLSVPTIIKSPPEVDQDPSSNSVRQAAHPTTLSAPQISLEELEERASPLMESFESTAWGHLMRRMSHSDKSPPLDSHRHGRESRGPSPNRHEKEDDPR